MADSTLPDINWGGLAKLFVQSLDQKRESSSKKKGKPTPKNFMRIPKAQPTHTSYRQPQRQPPPPPDYPHDPRHPQVILSQVQALRMQLLHQLVYYQKQLLALQIPYIPPHCCHSKQCSSLDKKGVKRKLNPVKTINTYEKQPKWLKTSQVVNQNLRGQPKVNRKKKTKLHQKKFTKKTNKAMPSEQSLDCNNCVSSNSWDECVSNNQQCVERKCVKEQNHPQEESSKKTKLIHNRPNLDNEDAYDRAVALERLRNVPLSTKRNKTKDLSSFNNPKLRNRPIYLNKEFGNNLSREQICIPTKATNKPMN